MHPLLVRLISESYILLFVAGAYVIYRLVRTIYITYHIRRSYTDIPSLPRHWAFGNLINGGKLLSPALGRHPDYGFEEIWHELGEPDGFLLDMTPVSVHLMIVADPGIAEAVTQPSHQFKYSTGKSDTLSAMSRLIGWESLIMVEGEEWKNLRKRFNKGFSPSHLHSLSPLIISKTEYFVERLKSAAKTGEVFAMKDYAQDLTTDIITELTMEKDFHSQSLPEGEGHKSQFGILTAARILSSLCFRGAEGLNLSLIDPIRPTKSWFYEQIYNRNIESVVVRQLDAEKQSQESDKPQSSHAKSITRLATTGLPPTKALISNTVDQIKSFLFAGQDTTATLVQWICYELSKAPYSPPHAAMVRKLIAEHDAAFGSDDPFSALDVLQKQGQAEQILGAKLPYTTAFIKEILRLHPPAGTARRVPPISKSNPHPLVVNLNGKPVTINGLRLYICQWLIHRDKKIWGPDAHVFNPDRWLDEEYVAKLRPGAWRPFERGPRNCIGQELALMEGKIVMAVVTRGFVFEKIGYTGRNGEKEVWNISNVTSVPVDGMRMKVRLKSSVALDGVQDKEKK